MPKPRLNVVSFYVHRPDEHPDAADYVAMLRLLQKSCDNLNLRHVVLTDTVSFFKLPPGMLFHAVQLPMPLMQAVTHAQASWMDSGLWEGADSILVGADCIMRRHPGKTYPAENVADLCVTYRPGHKRYPINTGAIFVRSKARALAIPLFRNIADRGGAKWGDDQRAIEGALLPMPRTFSVQSRWGMKVAFVPMAGYNDVPRSAFDPCSSSTMLHFRGKARKQLMFDWAARWGYGHT